MLLLEKKHFVVFLDSSNAFWWKWFAFPIKVLSKSKPCIKPSDSNSGSVLVKVPNNVYLRCSYKIGVSDVSNLSRKALLAAKKILIRIGDFCVLNFAEMRSPAAKFPPKTKQIQLCVKRISKQQQQQQQQQQKKEKEEEKTLRTKNKFLKITTLCFWSLKITTSVWKQRLSLAVVAWNGETNEATVQTKLKGLLSMGINATERRRQDDLGILMESWRRRKTSSEQTNAVGKSNQP